MLQVGNTIMGGRLIIVAISDDYRVFTVKSNAPVLSDPATPFLITFDTNQTVADINALLIG